LCACRGAHASPHARATRACGSPARAEGRHARRCARRATPRRSARRPSWAMRLPRQCSAPRTARAATAPAHASPAGAAACAVGTVHALHVQGMARACSIEGNRLVCYMKVAAELSHGCGIMVRAGVFALCMRRCHMETLQRARLRAAPLCHDAKRAAPGYGTPACLPARPCLLCLRQRLRWGGRGRCWRRRGDTGCQATTPVLAQGAQVGSLLAFGSWDYYQARWPRPPDCRPLPARCTRRKCSADTTWTRICQ